MKPSIQTVGQILYSPSQYIVPVFQRHYRWEEPQWRKLWEDIQEIQEPAKKGNHFMGFLVFVPALPQPGRNIVFSLVDGQQRISTISILLAVLRNAARERGDTDFAGEIEQFYLFHPTKRADERYRLLPKDRDRDNYLAVIEDKGEPTGRVADARKFFADRVAELNGQEPETLRNLFNVVCQRLEFMCATLETENAYNIYKGLNSTGVPLGASDLIRNFVFMHVPPDDHDEFDARQWAPLEQRFTRSDGTLNEERLSGFFRDSLMVSGRYVSPKRTFGAFEERYEATDFSPAELAEELDLRSRHYEVIAGGCPDRSSSVTRALARLNALESSTTYPLLLLLFDQRESGTLSDVDLSRAIRCLSGFILRRFVCGESSRGYGRMFVRAIEHVVQGGMEGLYAFLIERGWPDGAKFREAFVTFPLYKRGYTKHILATLEEARGHKEPASLASVEVEHIMPQTLTDEWRADLGEDAEQMHAAWLHTPGNLTLSAYNAESL